MNLLLQSANPDFFLSYVDSEFMEHPEEFGARALQVILGGDLYDARTTELYGWVNLAVPPGQLDTLAGQRRAIHRGRTRSGECDRPCLMMRP